MNRVYRHYYTPKLRSKMQTFENASVGTGANAKIGGQWQSISVRFDIPNSPTQEKYTLQMDRETAQRIVNQLSAYLADTTPLPAPTIATRSA